MTEYKAFENALSDILVPEGFCFIKRIKRGMNQCTFYRKINDVVQYITFRRIRPGYCQHAVYYDVYPLSLEFNDFSEGEDLQSTLRRFDCQNNDLFSDKWKEAKLPDTDFSEIADAVRRFVLPLFLSSTDSASAYYTLCEHQKRIYTHGVTMHNKGLLLLSLQARDYENAEKHIYAVAEKNLKSYLDKQTALGQTGSHLFKERLRDYQAYSELMEHVKMHDDAYIASYLEPKFSRTKKFLKGLR